MWYPERSVRHALKRVTIAESSAERTEVCGGHSSEVFFIMKDNHYTFMIWPPPISQ